MAFFVKEGSGPLIEPVAFSNAEYERRLSGVRQILRERNLDALLCFSPENLYYLTGHDTPGYYWYQACLVTHDHPPINILRALEATNTLGRSWSRKVVEFSDVQDPIAATAWLLAELGLASRRVGFESEAFFLTATQYDRLRAAAAQLDLKLVGEPAIIESMRAVKSEEELAYIRKGGEIVGAAMRVAFETAGEGVPERAVAAQVNRELIARGSGYQGLPTFLGTGPRPALAHSTWSDRTMQKGDGLSYEISASVERYTCALFRMGIVGEPPLDFSRKLETCARALDNVLGTARAGVTAGEVFEAGHDAFVKSGFDDGIARRIGYSVGISYPPDWGEGHIIDLRRGSEKVLQAGMTFHTTPGLVVPGVGVVNISETFIVTETGTDVVTEFPLHAHVV